MSFLSFPRTFDQGLVWLASVAAGVVLFIAPFRASAGIRGTLLVFASLTVVILYWRTRQLKTLLPPDRFLGFAVALWILAASAWSFMGPSPALSLNVVKRDILYPMLAAVVFFALTRTRADLLRWVCVMVAGLVILTVMVVREPFLPLALSQEPAYVSVGWLTTWLVTLSPSLAVLLFLPRRERRRAIAWTVLLVVAMVCVLLSAWLSGNRTVWVCFAAMAATGAAFEFRNLETAGERRRMIAIAAVLLVAIGILMADSMRYRAEASAPKGRNPIAFALQDNRVPIWREAFAMIRERPLQGYGYANPEIGDAFSERFADPWARRVFRHAHNVVLNRALQMGVTGGVAILALFAALGAAFLRRAQSRQLARLTGVCGITLVVGVLLRNSTDDFFSRHGVLFFGAVAGMLLGVGTRRPPLSGTRNRRLPPPGG